MNELKPAIRIDGGKRTDLKARRERRGLEINPSTPHRMPSPEARAKERAREERAMAQMRRDDGGKDGTRLHRVKVRDLQGQKSRTLEQTVRSRPGTFDWRYGRAKHNAHFLAGSHFAQLWERAGITVASSANFLRGTSSGYSTGISEARMKAIQTVAHAVSEIGKNTAERMVAYCVLGETTSSIARRYGQPPRDMAAVLHQDLSAVAEHFRFLSRS